MKVVQSIEKNVIVLICKTGVKLIIGSSVKTPHTPLLKILISF